MSPSWQIGPFVPPRVAQTQWAITFLSAVQLDWRTLTRTTSTGSVHYLPATDQPLSSSPIVVTPMRQSLFLPGTFSCYCNRVIFPWEDRRRIWKCSYRAEVDEWDKSLAILRGKWRPVVPISCAALMTIGFSRRRERYSALLSRWLGRR